MSSPPSSSSEMSFIVIDRQLTPTPIHPPPSQDRSRPSDDPSPDDDFRALHPHATQNVADSRSDDDDDSMPHLLTRATRYIPSESDSDDDSVPSVTRRSNVHPNFAYAGTHRRNHDTPPAADFDSGTDDDSMPLLRRRASPHDTTYAYNSDLDPDEVLPTRITQYPPRQIQFDSELQDSDDDSMPDLDTRPASNTASDPDSRPLQSVLCLEPPREDLTSLNTIADPDDQIGIDDTTNERCSDNSSNFSSHRDDIGVFQQSSVSSEESWHTRGVPASPTEADLHSQSSSATFNSNFSDSQTTPQFQAFPPTPDALPPQTVRIPQDDVPDPDTPAIVSQDPLLVDSWRQLFAKASRPPTNMPDPPHPATAKFRQEYLDSVEQRSNLPFGDSMDLKLQDFCRVYFVNVNGISAANEFLAFQDALESLRANQVDIFGFSETNLDWLRHTVRDKCGKICNDFYGSSLLATSTSSLRSNGNYKPGGTCTGLTQAYCGRYQTSGSDPHGLGRWSYIRLNGKQDKSLVVVTAYRVCQGNIGAAGTSTAFHQEWHLLRLSGNPKPNPRQSFIQDLSVEIEKWKKEGASVIIGGDFNENLGDTIDGLAQLVSNSNLTDVHAHFHGTADEPATFVRGTKRLDYVFATEDVLPFIYSSGIEPFFSTVHSDHRGLFLDLDVTGLLGGKTENLLPPQLRAISSTSPHIAKYINQLHKYLDQHNVIPRSQTIFAVLQNSTIPVGPKILVATNRLDRDITRGMHHAEDACRQPDRPPWSEALHLASKAVRFWKTYVSGTMNKCDVTIALSAICYDLEWDTIPTVDLRTAKLELAQAQKDLQGCRTHAAENRQKFISKLVAAAALQNDTTREKALKRQLHVEAMKSCYRKLRSALRPTSLRGGITKVEVKIGETTVAYTEKADVHRECLERNRRHFNQAAGTPWTIYPLSEVGTSATKFKTDKMPDGRRVRMPADTFLETNTLLDLIQSAEIPANANISAEISFDDFVSAISVWSENTSTSPSGRHLGHYKALVSVYKDTHAKLELKIKATEILQLFVDLLNLASTKGFALDRWKTVINVMIYKKPGVYLIDKLRVIHLFEADYNFVIGLIFGRRALYSGVHNHTLHPSQWAQPGRQCADVVVLRELTLSMAHMLKIALGGFENDAAACYDRLLMNLMGAAFESMGVPEGPLRLQAEVLLNVIHYLKTGFGITIDSYTSDAIYRIHGVGQGSKAGPVSWARVSSLLFQAQDILGHGVKFTCPDRIVQHSRHSDGFVDDTTMYLCDQLAWLEEPPSKREIFELLRKDAQTWERLLWSSGGLLEINKCRYYVIQWKFGSTGASKMVTASEAGFPAFRLTEGNTGNYVTVPQLDCKESFRTLGIHKTIAGDQTEQIRVLTERSNNFGKGILASATTPFEAWTGYFTIWYPSCNYPLAATFLPRSACSEIQSFATNATLVKCKFNRKFPRAVVFGPPRYGGMGWRHMWYEQGIQHVLIIIKHLRTPGHFQSLLQINLRWYSLLAGVSFAPLEFPEISLPHLDCKWLDATRTFLAHCRAKLKIPSLPQPVIYRTEDRFIMDAVLSLSYKPSQVKQVNCCRLFLQATRLSEITTLQGDSIDRTAWSGAARLASNHDWPRQGRPGPDAWRLWRRTLIKAFCHQPDGNVLVSAPGVLDRPLGSWLPASRPFQLARYPAFLEPTNNQLYLPVPDASPPAYEVAHPLDRRMTHFISYDVDALPAPIHQVHALPALTIPVELIPQGAIVKVEKSRTPRAAPPGPVSFAAGFFPGLLPGVTNMGTTTSLSHSTARLPAFTFRVPVPRRPSLPMLRRGCPQARRLHWLGNRHGRRSSLGLHRRCYRMVRELLPLRRPQPPVHVRIPAALHPVPPDRSP